MIVTIIIVVISILLLSYIALILLYEKGWRLQPTFIIPQNFYPKTRISVIIPARNEEATIEKCVRSILINNYPKELLEIIVVDDHSEDNTYKIVDNISDERLKCLHLQDYLHQNEKLNAYKKKALQAGINESNGELIVTTDADCIVQENWLLHIAAIYESQKPVMIVGTVRFFDNKNLLSIFQSLDFMTMQGITAATHRLKLGNMSNGANLAFSKKAFDTVKGYEGVDHLASGDDYLLMAKMRTQFPDGISYLKSSEAIVSTASQPTWKSFINQRIRWASKMGKYDDHKLTLTLLLVYMFNVLFIGLFIAAFWDHYFWILMGALLIIKTVVELFFIKDVALFFKKEKELVWFPLLQPLHILYIVIAGFLGFFGKYSWKDRQVK